MKPHLNNQALLNFARLVSVVLMINALLSSTLGSPPSTEGLVAYYPFSGNARDDSGFARNGTIHGAIPTTNRFGISNQALGLDGLGSYVDGASTINDVTNTFTVSLWFNTTNLHGDDRFAPFAIYPSHGQTTWNDASVGTGISAGSDIIKVWEHTHDFNPRVVSYSGNFAGWTHVVLVYSNRVPILYVNGSLASKGAQSSQPLVRPSNGQKLSSRNQFGGIGGGAQVGGDGQWFRGLIDEVRIYNRPFSDEEVAALFQSREAQFAIQTAVELELATEFGKLYQVQVRSAVEAGEWINIGDAIQGSGETVRVLRSIREVPNSYFRAIELP
jgi:hypothetical protein